LCVCVCVCVCVAVWLCVCVCGCVLQTLLHENRDPVYVGSLLPAYLVLIAVGVWSFHLVGGSVKNLKACCFRQHNGYNL